MIKAISLISFVLVFAVSVFSPAYADSHEAKETVATEDKDSSSNKVEKKSTEEEPDCE